MNTAAGLPLPKLSRGRFAHGLGNLVGQDYIDAWTDEALFNACGVRIVFSERNGGLSEPPYSSLNLKVPGYSDTSQEALCPDPHIAMNRRILASAFGAQDLPLISPHQVHEDTILFLNDASEESLMQARQDAEAGADAVLFSCSDVAALICVADCVPLVFVAPNASFVAIHCGWRGVALHLARKAFLQLMQQSNCEAGDINIYIGAYIHHECFEVSAETAQRFEEEFDASVLRRADGHSGIHVDLGAALRMDLLAAGALDARIADMDICTVCSTEHFFSYRAEDKLTGRQGALVFRRS